MKFRELRFPCDFPAELQLGAETREVLITNISRLGARVTPAGGLKPGDRVTLLILGRRHEATLRWTSPAEAGLRFDSILGQSLIATIRKSPGTRLARRGWNLHLRELSEKGGGQQPGTG